MSSSDPWCSRQTSLSDQSLTVYCWIYGQKFSFTVRAAALKSRVKHSTTEPLRSLSDVASVPTQNLNWGFSYPLILKLEGMK